MKHTPGPWIVDDYETPDVIAEDGSVICHVNCCDDFPCIGEDNDKAQMAALEAELKANASLIAAAPDLYAALKALCDLEDHDDLLVQAGLAAIAKAEGR
jgi:hypothetical protein